MKQCQVSGWLCCHLYLSAPSENGSFKSPRNFLFSCCPLQLMAICTMAIYLCMLRCLKQCVVLFLHALMKTDRKETHLPRLQPRKVQLDSNGVTRFELNCPMTKIFGLFVLSLLQEPAGKVWPKMCVKQPAQISVVLFNTGSFTELQHCTCGKSSETHAPCLCGRKTIGNFLHCITR